jgi:hypothetical protein
MANVVERRRIEPLPNAVAPPANSLRNQPALLGTAGLVGSVNPSTLRQTPGSTLTNPIVVKDSPRLDIALDYPRL